MRLNTPDTKSGTWKSMPAIVSGGICPGPVRLTLVCVVACDHSVGGVDALKIEEMEKMLKEAQLEKARLIESRVRRNRRAADWWEFCRRARRWLWHNGGGDLSNAFVFFCRLPCSSSWRLDRDRKMIRSMSSPATSPTLPVLSWPSAAAKLINQLPINSLFHWDFLIDQFFFFAHFSTLDSAFGQLKKHQIGISSHLYNLAALERLLCKCNWFHLQVTVMKMW